MYGRNLRSFRGAEINYKYKILYTYAYRHIIYHIIIFGFFKKLRAHVCVCVYVCIHS